MDGGGRPWCYFISTLSLLQNPHITSLLLKHTVNHNTASVQQDVGEWRIRQTIAENKHQYHIVPGPFTWPITRNLPILPKDSEISNTAITTKLQHTDIASHKLQKVSKPPQKQILGHAEGR
jgi:hypothetical protein